MRAGGESVKTILYFGDSNTWGYNPRDKRLYGMDERWPGVMRKSRGAGY